MKKTLFDEERILNERVDHEFKKMWIWEFLRRNKEYIEDYRRFGEYDEMIKGKRINDDETKEAMFEKWNLFWDVLPDPEVNKDTHNDGMLWAPPYAPEPNLIEASISYFTEPRMLEKRRIAVLRPGEKTGHYYGDKILDHWAVYDYNKHSLEKLTEKNCPRSMSLTISIEPNNKKSDLEKKLMESFEKAYEKVSKAQKLVLKKTPVRPRFKEFEKYIKVYDLKKANQRISWSQVAKEIFPDEVKKHISPHKKRETELVLPSTRDKVRYYWKQAKYYIEKGGWRNL